MHRTWTCLFLITNKKEIKMQVTSTCTCFVLYRNNTYSKSYARYLTIVTLFSSVKMCGRAEAKFLGTWWSNKFSSSSIFVASERCCYLLKPKKFLYVMSIGDFVLFMCDTLVWMFLFCYPLTVYQLLLCIVLCNVISNAHNFYHIF